MEFLIKKTKLETEEKYPLHKAIENGRYREAETLLKKGYDPNELDSNGQSPLVIAVVKNNPDIIELLLNNRADFYQKTGPDILRIAFTFKNREAIISLIKNGIALDKKDLYGYNHISSAINNDWDDIAVNLITSKKVDLNTKDRSGHTPLMISIFNSKPKISQVLIENRADLNVKDDLGRTALHHAVLYDARTTVNNIVSKCESLNEQDKEGKTAAMLARELEYTEAEKIIITGIKNCNNRKLATVLMASRTINEGSPFGEEVLPIDIYNAILEFSDLPPAKREEEKKRNRNPNQN